MGHIIMFEEEKMYEKIQAENERIRDLTRLAKERKEFNLMLRQKTRLRLKTPHAERTNHLADCDQLLVKTVSSGYACNLDLCLQLRYLNWVLRGVLCIHEHNELLLEDPPSLLVQSQKSYCRFPNKFHSNQAWNAFVDATEPVYPKQKLKKSQIELIKDESKKWELNKQLERVVKARVPRARHKQNVLAKYANRAQKDKMFQALRNESPRILSDEVTRRDPLTHWLFTLKRRFTADEVYRHGKEFDRLGQIELPTLTLHLQVCFLIHVDSMKDFILQDPNMMAAVQYVRTLLKIDKKYFTSSIFSRKNLFQPDLRNIF